MKKINYFFLLASLTLYFSSISVNACSNRYGRIVNQGPKNEKVIALTFDDGPHPKFTNEILDILKEYDIKATFFVLGKFAEAYPEIIIRQWQEGHEIGNHTYSHVDAKSVSKKILYEEYKKTQEIIENLVNNRPKLFRPPYGSFDSQALDIMEMDNSIMVLWSSHQDSKDWSNPEVDEIVNTTLSSIKNGDIILFHDYVYYNKSNTVEALKIIIPELINRGYKFVTISELLNLIE
ncbi:polysaccharide deacetylase family protein [Tepidimicrobium xylanilyticum]|uniref:Polysaccharide deacetylase family sporulation protein PdaB n=1 Tax=Tepidimicrobium xylanilyticum TaxID=1123352 RepID=A0A1H3CMW3_9FIRM|nr:polysaccharide deacetylase family protein [Tepidimicrobium xylanilyticum]SDX55370.1 polysaccharide deacetylase family sporulation protein PdaB [Tepidimicrobium xylanilyticum]